MTRLHMMEDHAYELFANLQALCHDCPELPGNHGAPGPEELGFEGQGHYDRLMSSAFDIEVEWGSERLA